MNHLQTAIVDDNHEYAEKLKRVIQEAFLNPGIDIYESGKDIQKTHDTYDMVFLDIELGKEDGILLSKMISDRTNYIVYITNQAHRVTEAFGYKTVGFLVKTMSDEQLEERLKQLYGEYLSQEIILQTNSGEMKIQASSILYLTILNRKMYCSVRNGKEVQIQNTTFSELQKKLDPDMFIQTDRSTIVNLNDIIAITGTELRMSNGSVLYTSRRLKNDVERAWLRKFR